MIVNNMREAWELCQQRKKDFGNVYRIKIQGTHLGNACELWGQQYNKNIWLKHIQRTNSDILNTDLNISQKKTQKTCPQQNTVGISKKITIVWEMTACRPWELAPQMFEKTTNELPCQALISKLNLTKEH